MPLDRVRLDRDYVTTLEGNLRTSAADIRTFAAREQLDQYGVLPLPTGSHPMLQRLRDTARAVQSSTNTAYGRVAGMFDDLAADLAQIRAVIGAQVDLATTSVDTYRGELKTTADGFGELTQPFTPSPGGGTPPTAPGAT